MSDRRRHGDHRAPATIRTRVNIPLHFPDGYETTAEAHTFNGLADGAEHLALVFEAQRPGARDSADPPLVRLHSECLTGDVFGSARCDCGPQLREAVERLSERGGVLLYLRQEGRGSASTTSSTPTPSRTAGSTPTRPTPPWACPRTPATTPRPPRCCPRSAWTRWNFSRTIPTRPAGCETWA
ncbi:hypothetical protein GCM10029992_34130 [Glycomyces albus]